PIDERINGMGKEVPSIHNSDNYGILSFLLIPLFFL
ncbi:unnamed protein product, partial [marine sediment metagenome]